MRASIFLNAPGGRVREVMTVHFAAGPDGADLDPRPKKGRGKSAPTASDGQGAVPERAGPMTRCRDPRARAFLVPYALSSLREESAAVFEAHLLACGSCFRDLKCLDRAGALLRSFMGSGSSASEWVKLGRGAREVAEPNDSRLCSEASALGTETRELSTPVDDERLEGQSSPIGDVQRLTVHAMLTGSSLLDLGVRGEPFIVKQETLEGDESRPDRECR